MDQHDQTSRRRQPRSPRCPSGLGHSATEMIRRRYWITDAGRAALADDAARPVLQQIRDAGAQR